LLFSIINTSKHQRNKMLTVSRHVETETKEKLSKGFLYAALGTAFIGIAGAATFAFSAVVDAPAIATTGALTTVASMGALVVSATGRLLTAD
jgi:hypothetical protein